MANIAVLERCEINGIESILMAAQFRWISYVIRMDNNRIPKRIIYSQLAHGTRSAHMAGSSSATKTL